MWFSLKLRMLAKRSSRHHTRNPQANRSKSGCSCIVFSSLSPGFLSLNGKLKVRAPDAALPLARSLSPRLPHLRQRLLPYLVSALGFLLSHMKEFSDGLRRLHRASSKAPVKDKGQHPASPTSSNSAFAFICMTVGLLQDFGTKES